MLREVETLKSRIAEAEGTGAELTELRAERDQIRGRVSEMLQQLDAFNLYLSTAPWSLPLPHA